MEGGTTAAEGNDAVRIIKRPRTWTCLSLAASSSISLSRAFIASSSCADTNRSLGFSPERSTNATATVESRHITTRPTLGRALVAARWRQTHS